MQARDQPALGWTTVLRRQPVRMVEGQVQTGYTNMFELICCECGDNPDVDYGNVSSELQQIRGPYQIAAGIAAYKQHLELYPHQRADRQPAPSAHDARGRSGPDSGRA
jgi:hypothetical protein